MMEIDMHKFLAAAGIATLMGVGYGQTADAATIQANQVRVQKLIGSDVYDRQNEDVASVKDLILDKSGKVDTVVLSYGTTAGMGGKYISIPFSSIKFDNNRLTIDETKAQLSAMPAYQLEDSTSGAGEGAVPVTGGHASGSSTAH